MRYILAILILAALACGGCETVAPADKAKADAAKAAFNEASGLAEKAQAIMAEHLAEYKLIKAKVDAGEAVPAVLVARYAELQGLISRDVATVNDAVAKLVAAKKANDEAAAAGIAWYNRVDWWTVGKVSLGILGGVAGVYFPIARPAIAAAQSCISGVAAVAKDDPSAGQAIKDAVLASSRALGAEAKVDALVQKYDPPKA